MAPSQALSADISLPSTLWSSNTLPPPRLLDILTQIAHFFDQLGYTKTSAALLKEAGKSGLTIDIAEWERCVQAQSTTPLLNLYEQWCESTGKYPSLVSSVDVKSGATEDSSDSDSDSEDSDSDSESEQDAAEGVLVDVEAEETSDDESDEKSISSDDSSDSDSSAEIPAKIGSKRKRIVTPPSSDDDSSSDSDDDDGSESSSSSDSDARPAKKTKVESSASSSASDSSSSESDSDSSSSSESDSDSVSTSSSSSSDSDAPRSTSLPKKVKKTKSAKSGGKSVVPASASLSVTHKDAGSQSSETLDADSAAEKDQETDGPGNVHPDRLRQMPTTKKEVSAQIKKQNVPFSRIPADQKVDPRFASNDYVSYDYADRAYQDLSVTKGKGFTKEKNKKKRGAYRGGAIDFTPKGIKFDN